MSAPNCNGHFSLNPFANVQMLTIGNEQHSVLVIDNVLSQTESLLQYAKQNPPFGTTPKDFYPGVRKSIEGAYPKLLGEILHRFASDNFNVGSSIATVDLCALSLTTTPASQLRPIQSLPHFDTSDPMQFAAVHYLCDARHGGTSFYQHRQTGYESIAQDRIHHYASTLKHQVSSKRFTGQQYMNGDNEWFMRIASIDAKPNRIIFYPGYLLHSADISSDETLSSDPNSGRLTANTFIHFNKQK